MKYFLIDKTKHKDFDFTNSQNKSDTIRWNLDKTKFIAKFVDEKVPVGMKGGLTGEEVIAIINNPEEGWINPDNEI